MPVYFQRVLLCKKLTQVTECFEFQCIPCRIQEKHGGLLTRLSFESCVGFDHEMYVCLLDARSQGLPIPLG